MLISNCLFIITIIISIISNLLTRHDPGEDSVARLSHLQGIILTFKAKAQLLHFKTIQMGAHIHVDDCTLFPPQKKTAVVLSILIK